MLVPVLDAVHAMSERHKLSPQRQLNDAMLVEE